MSARNLFSIVLKIIGIFFIKDVLLSIPTLVSFLPYYLGNERGDSFGALALFVLSIGCYVLVTYYLIFRTDWVIDKLKLEQGFNTEPMTFNLHRSAILSIAVIIVGALMVVNALPLLTRHLILYYEQAMASYTAQKPDRTYMIVYILQIIIGLLLMGSQRSIVNYIELKRKENNKKVTP